MGNQCDRAMDSHWSGHHAEAVQLLLRAIDSGECPSYFKIHLGLSQLYAGQLDAAETTLREFLEDYPDTARGWYYLGLLHFTRHRPGQAAQALRQSIQKDPNDPDAHKVLASYYVATRKPAEAERSLVRAMELNPGDFEVKYLLGRLYQSTDRLKEAVRFFEEAIRLNPNHARSHAYLGTLRFALGEGERAGESFQLALDANRRSPRRDFVPHLEYGIYLSRIGELESGIQHLRAAVELGENETAGYFELARSLNRLGEKGEARSVLERGLVIDRSEPRLHYLLGRICYDLGDEECGRTHTALSEGLRK